MRRIQIVTVVFQLASGCGLDVYFQEQEACGNGRLEPGEACDDGNVNDGDGCSHDCKSNEKCNNGLIDRAIGEVCEDFNDVDGDGCSHDCKHIDVCGDHVIDQALGEVCDDGNLVDGDGCSRDCKSLEKCGNGIIDVGEQCDTGGPSATCDQDCTIAQCGDAVLNLAAGEQCDDGSAVNGIPGSHCSVNCLLLP